MKDPAIAFQLLRTLEMRAGAQRNLELRRIQKILEDPSAFKDPLKKLERSFGRYDASSVRLQNVSFVREQLERAYTLKAPDTTKTSEKNVKENTPQTSP